MDSIALVRRNFRCHCGGVLLSMPDRDALRCDVQGHEYGAIDLIRWDRDGTLNAHWRINGRLPPPPVVLSSSDG
jgi:hypothetical protein